jgi:hypothetical protein
MRSKRAAISSYLVMNTTRHAAVIRSDAVTGDELNVTVTRAGVVPNRDLLFSGPDRGFGVSISAGIAFGADVVNARIRDGEKIHIVAAE